MEDDLRKALPYLTEHITNEDGIIIRLIAEGIFSVDDEEKITNENTSRKRSYGLIKTIGRKDWSRVRSQFMKILRETNNSHCADKIESLSNLEPENKNAKIYSIPQCWPEKLVLVKSFYERKSDDQLLIEHLEDILEKSENGMTIINQKVTVSGLGGVGKTTTAKWYAIYFAEKYDHVLWIDCGEGSLSKSFEKLAADLNIPASKDLPQLARKCFEELKSSQCLWIFDNAECYSGHQGISKLLPKHPGFHTIITSRNREWGNENGDGKIYEMQLDTFSTAESVDFFKRNIKNLPIGVETGTKLVILCELLGNLPLALQIAVATLNGQRIDVENYIQRVRETDDIIHTSFDDYEKTINKAMKISLDLIKAYEGESGNLAFRILTVFGYIKPDFVSTRFFESVEQQNGTKIDAAGEILERYSLITRTQWDLEYATFSIHRLFQQVIRYNGKETEQEVIRKILRCQDFLDYKLIPYMYTTDEIQEEFLGIKALLIDQLELEEMLVRRRFQEAVDLSLIIKNTLQTSSAEYNYGFCLDKNGEERESIKIFERMYNGCEIGNGTLLLYYDKRSDGILDLKEEPTKGLLAGQLYIIYWRRKMYTKAKEILEMERHLTFKYSHQLLNDVILSITKVEVQDYDLKCKGYEGVFSLELKDQNFGNESTLELCSLQHTTGFPRNLHRLRVSKVTMMKEDETFTEFDTSNCPFPLNLQRLHYEYQHRTTNLILSTAQLPSIKHLELFTGSILNIDSSSCKICPSVLKLLNCSIFCEKKLLPDVLLNQFVDFKHLIDLHILPGNTAFSLMMDIPISANNILLRTMTILNWEEAQWTFAELNLKAIDFVSKNKLQIHSLEVAKSSIHLSVLPQNLQRLYLEDMKEIIFSQPIHLPRLNCLEFYDQVPDCITHFSNCLNLVNLSITALESSLELNVDEIPKSVKQLKLSQLQNKISLRGNMSNQLSTFILETASGTISPIEVEFTLTKVRTTTLAIICASGIKGENVDKKLHLVQKCFEENSFLQTIIIGEFIWEFPSFSSTLLSKHVDKEASHYVFEKCEGKGRGIEGSRYNQIADMKTK